MPFDRKGYPADWKQVSQEIRFGRAAGICEGPGCGVSHGAFIQRVSADPFLWVPCRYLRPGPNAKPLALKRDRFGRALNAPVRVILTTAHLCGCKPLCGNPDHLRALCQRCHFEIDRPKASRRRRLQAWRDRIAKEAESRRAREASGLAFDRARGQGLLIAEAFSL